MIKAGQDDGSLNSSIHEPFAESYCEPSTHDDSPFGVPPAAILGTSSPRSRQRLESVRTCWNRSVGVAWTVVVTQVAVDMVATHHGYIVGSFMWL